MGLLNFFKKSNDTKTTEVNNEIDHKQEDKIIDRNIFVKDPQNNISNHISEDDSTAWKRIFNRIRNDYEIEGYNDALSTADVKYRDDNKEILKLNLRIDFEEAEVEI